MSIPSDKISMNIKENLWYSAAVLYSRINPFFINHFGIDKLGFFLKKISQPRILKVEGLLFQMNPEVAACFPKMIGGRFNEQETHRLFERVLDRVDQVDLFVDVGSNIGEFVVALGTSGKVKRVIGFEPNPACVKSCLQSVELNALRNVTLTQKVLTDVPKPIRFDLRPQNAYLHSIFDNSFTGSEVVNSSTIDAEIQDSYAKTILKIDVEGAELQVIKGGKSFVKNNLPLIVFEYNHISKLHFSLQDFEESLPKGYKIFRIRPADGFLDADLSETWNCVAVHPDSAFHDVVAQLVK